MELYQLKTFAAVAAEGNLTRASKRLHLSQPAVSAHIKALEDELGVVLFQRTPTGMVLSPAGTLLRGHADKILNEVAELKRQAVQLHGVVQGQVRVGINANPSVLRLPELMSRLRVRHPQLRVHLLQAMSGEVVERLEEGRLDAGFMFGGSYPGHVQLMELSRLEMVVAAAPQLGAEMATAEPSQLGRYPWIATPPNCPYRTVADSFFLRHRIAPTEVALVDDESVIQMMIKKGLGLSILLRQDAREAGLVIWGQETMHLPLGLACLSRRAGEPVLSSFLQVISELWFAGDSPG